MNMSRSKPRGGTRGGRDQFKWDDVKADADRENFLGHSVMAPVGRWQKGRDLLWYTRAAGVVNADTNRSVGERHSNVDDAVRSEASLVRRREEEAMRAALGLPPLRDNVQVVVAVTPSIALKSRSWQLC